MVKTKKNNALSKKKGLSKKKEMEYTGEKSLNKKGVWREIEFPLSKKLMYVPNTQDTKTSVVAKAHLEGRKWEPKIAAILTKYCKKGTTAIDMGAYIGTHTMSLVDGVGASGKVVTFEPQPWAYKGIKKSLAKNKIKNVKVVNAGLSDKKGKIKFCSDSSGSSSVCTERSAGRKKWAEVYDIPIVTLDSYNLKRVSIMKVDVEGHELNALMGAKKTIEKCRPVIVLEVWRKRTNRFQKIKDFMESVNYKIEHISADDFICFPKK
jgi:FkbM family methyltransferase